MKVKTGRNFIVLLLLLIYLHATAVHILHIPRLTNVHGNIHNSSGSTFNRRLQGQSHNFVYMMVRTAKIVAEQRKVVFQSIILCLLFSTFVKQLYSKSFSNLKWHNISILETIFSHHFLSLCAFRI
jgi:hypothetical protein